MTSNEFHGEIAEGPYFFTLLVRNNKFCAELGRVVLAASRLETTLKQVLELHAPQKDTEKATLGRLIRHIKDSKRLPELIPHLEFENMRRIYLVHKIHDLLSGMIEETILEKENLVPEDVHTYAERAIVLSENLNAITDIIIKKELNEDLSQND